MAARMRQIARLGITTSALLLVSPAMAQMGGPVASTAPAAAVPAGTAVTAFYDTYRTQPIWFRGGVDDPAVTQLIAILQRAPFDGFAAWPAARSQVQAAVAQARAATLADIELRRTISLGLGAYVQAIKRPTTGMIYAYPVLAPQGTRADQILLTAAAAPSLETYLAGVANVNPIYAQLRDAAWAEAQATRQLDAGSAAAGESRPGAVASCNGPFPARRLRFVDADALRERPASRFDEGDYRHRELPTPLIASIMYYITYNPYWHAPDHLVRKTIAPTFFIWE